MSSYFSTFLTGLQDVVDVALKQELKGVKVDKVLDGVVFYETELPIETVKKLSFLNNTFLLLHTFKNVSELSTEEFIKDILDNAKLLALIPNEVYKGNKTFRIIASNENQIVKVNNGLLQKAEDFFSNKLKLRLDKSNPDLEVWFIKRSEGFGLVGLRIGKKLNYEKYLHKGELRPELANLMCLIAELKTTDTVLDPFAGYGAIPIECAKFFSVSKVIAGEIDKSVFNILKEKVGKEKVILGRWNALNLNSLTDNSIDKIVTDPPWGLYGNKDMDINHFYEDMFKEFVRVLKPNGAIVLLTAQKELLERLLGKFPTLSLEVKYDTLVSGKKASIYKIKHIQN